jgi:hypothetical protein
MQILIPAQASPPTPPPMHGLHPLKILLSVVLFALVFHLVKRCCFGCKQRLRERRERRRRLRAERRAARRAAFRQACRNVVARVFRPRARDEEKPCENLIHSFFRRLLKRISGDEEKEAMLQQAESDGDSDIGNTMEQEIAQFRAAASVVTDLVAAEEGRAQYTIPPRETPREWRPTPPSPGTFAEYMPDDDIPPAYTERRRSVSSSNGDASLISDGFRITPGTSRYTPSSSSSENGGANDVLRSTKY